jgi:hypothetical protein
VAGRSTESLDGMRTLGILVRVAVAAVVTISATGCAESSFVLAPESRLPAWFDPPPGQPRENVTVKMDYYISSSGRDAKFTLLDLRGRQLMSKTGKMRNLYPTTLGAADYPMYEVISVDGVVDVIEHRKMEPIFYLANDPVVLKQLGVLDVHRSK